MGVSLDRARLALKLTPKALVVSTGAKGLSETAKLTLKLSWDVAQEFNQDYCGTEHILFSILSQKTLGQRYCCVTWVWELSLWWANWRST